jgi:hypothetical protein
VLPLKLARPRWWSGAALALGSTAPDLPYFLVGRSSHEWGHTLAGLFFFCVPSTLALVWLVRRLIARPLAARIPGVGFFHLKDYGLVAQGPALALRDVPSALVGAASHIALDACTHSDGWVVTRVAALRATVAVSPLEAPVYKLLQHGGTLAGAAITVAFLAWIGRRRLVLAWRGREAVPAPAVGLAASAPFWLTVAAGGLAGAGWSLAGLDGSFTGLDLAVGVFLRGTLGAFLALVAACAVVRDEAVSCAVETPASF